MSNVPAELKYSKEHEWLRKEADGTYTVGITEHAQELLGDMVFVDLPEVGATVSAGDDCAVAESVKAASDIYAPAVHQRNYLPGTLRPLQVFSSYSHYCHSVWKESPRYLPAQPTQPPAVVSQQTDQPPVGLVICLPAPPHTKFLLQHLYSANQLGRPGLFRSHWRCTTYQMA